jgi:hypothetical protein
VGCYQAACQLSYINNSLSDRSLPEDHHARALTVMVPVWIHCVPSEIFDINIYEELDSRVRRGIVLYSSIGNAFVFSLNGKIFWFEMDDYRIAKRFDGGFLCCPLSLKEIGIFRFEIVEALSTITPEISNSYCQALKAKQPIQ